MQLTESNIVKLFNVELERAIETITEADENFRLADIAYDRASRYGGDHEDITDEEIQKLFVAREMALIQSELAQSYYKKVVDVRYREIRHQEIIGFVFDDLDHVDSLVTGIKQAA